MLLSTHSTTMALQIVVVACLVAVAAAQYGGYAPAHYAAPEPYDAHPQYNFEYSVRDDSTYDIKSQKESRDGDNVYGVYELVEPDGTRRVVEYSDTGYGFQANVQRTPASYAAPAYRPAAYAAPAYRPAAYAAPAYSRPAYSRY